MDEIISEKNDRADGSSSCSNSAPSQLCAIADARQLLTFCMLVTQRILTHVGQLYCPFRACIHKPVTTLGMEFGGGDDFGQLLHVGWLDVNDVETLVLNVEVPQVYS